VTAQIPAMTAEGTVDGEKWTELGQLMPVTAPSPSSNGTSVMLGPASFYWQDDPGATPLTAAEAGVEQGIAFVCGSNGFVQTGLQPVLEARFEPEQVRTQRFGPTG